MTIHESGDQVTAGSAGRRGRDPGTRGLLTRLTAIAATAALGVAGWSLPAHAAPAAPPAPSAPTAVPHQETTDAAGTYIVRARAGHLDELTAKLAARHLTVTKRLAVIDAVVVQLPAGAASRLRTDPDVVSVTANAPVTLTSANYSAAGTFRAATTYDPNADGYSLANDEKITGVRTAWSQGYTGKGVDIALIDSGVTPVPGLSDTGKIINGPDLTPESQNPATRYLDTYGHGTHMAGILAGHDTAAGTNPATYATDTTHFLGVAPDARIVSVKVADAHGNTDVTQVIAAVDWVVQHAHDPGMNIRVLNLSFGTNSTQDWMLDPLSYAVDVAWKSGIVVVTSAGNAGAGGVTSPATNQDVLAVGAVDSRGTTSLSDDTVPSFSSLGGLGRGPDMVAPGSHVQSLRVPGSYIDTQYATTGAINDQFFRGSGTSQAAAFVSGATALYLQKRPGDAPSTTKWSLKYAAAVQSMPGGGIYAAGWGMLNLPYSLKLSACPLCETTYKPTGTGSLEAARGDAHLILNGVTLTGEKDINGQPFNSATMAAAEAARTSWSGGTWNGAVWAGSGWSGNRWTDAAWTGSSWDGKSWAGNRWTSGTWDGKSWASSNWTGSTWTGSSWTGNRWTGKSWADNDWS